MNNVSEILYKNRERDSVAVVYDEKEITYRELNKRCIGISKLIHEEDTKVVGVYIDNSIEYIEAFFSVIYAGKILLPINCLFTSSEVEKIAERYGVKVIVTLSKYKERFTDECKIKFIYLDELMLDLSKIDEQSRYYEPESSFVMYNPTSGTTGESKLVTYEHQSIVNGVDLAQSQLKKDTDTVDLISISMCAMFVVSTQFLLDIYVGAKIILMSGALRINKIYKLIDRYKITHLASVSSFIKVMMEEFDKDRYNVSSLKVICVGGEKVGAELYTYIKEKMGDIMVIQMYGLTECTVFASRNETDWNYKPQAVGRPIEPGQVQICDKEGKVLPTNESGEIWITNNAMMTGYYGGEKVSETGNWIHTGDYGMVDEEGYLYILGRVKNIVISGGRNIYPEEVEQVIGSYDKISEVRVRGESKEEVGEIVVADIIPNSKEFNEKELIAFLMSHLASYKIPAKFYIVNEIQKTMSKKIRRY